MCFALVWLWERVFLLGAADERFPGPAACCCVRADSCEVVALREVLGAGDYVVLKMGSFLVQNRNMVPIRQFIHHFPWEGKLFHFCGLVSFQWCPKSVVSRQ